MIYKKILLCLVILAALASGFLIRGYYNSSGTIPKSPTTTADTDAGNHEGHGHQDNEKAMCSVHNVHEAECLACAVQPKTLESFKGKQCEHQKPIIDCTECCYEAGVVKIDPSLIKNSDNIQGLFKTSPVRSQTVIQTIDTVGEITLNKNRVARIQSRVAGIISNVKIDLGQSVKEGDILLELDSMELHESQLIYLKYRSLLEVADRQFKRETALYEKKLTTEQEMLDARANYEETKIELESARKKLSALGMNEKEIEQLSDPTQHETFIPLMIRSPLTGVVINKNVTQGEQVNTDTEVAVIADLSTLWVWIDLYEKEFASVIHARQTSDIKVEISVESYPGKVFSGKIDYISDSVSEKTRTIKARISISNTDNLLKHGMFAKCKLLIISGHGRLIIPKESLLKDAQMAFVFKHLKENLFIKQDVKPGTEYTDYVEVIEGLNASDLIIVEGGFALKSDILREKMGAS
ncbi:MAG: efflux RND transporter periplasmic adaptor subunit [Planctomycetota bacterium]